MTQKIKKSFAFAPLIKCVTIQESEEILPVGKIYCVGKNYSDHAKEMGGKVDNDEPFFFSKPPQSITQLNLIPFPTRTKNLHHEVELVVVLKSECSNIMPDKAGDHIFGYAVGVDLTKRDLQVNAKESRKPWDLSKGFDNSAPCSALKTVSEVGHPDTGDASIWIKVNGKIRQESTLDLHIWNTAETINYLSSLCELKPGDLIYMGTPDGVASVVSGDKMHGHIDGLGDLIINIA